MLQKSRSRQKSDPSSMAVHARQRLMGRMAGTREWSRSTIIRGSAGDDRYRRQRTFATPCLID